MDDRTYLGIEFGSTRIKGVLIDEKGSCIASGSHSWENRLENGVWTYCLGDIEAGLQSCYKDLADDVYSRYSKKLETIGAIGVSGMMHGYLPLDENLRPLTEFRTWRNTITGEAAHELTEIFGFNIPQRWSVAHLYQAVLNGEEHVRNIRYLTTLAGYIHLRLTGEFVTGIGEASGMFPIDSAAFDYDAGMLEKFDNLVAEKSYLWKLRDILPKILPAGEHAGTLTESGARLIDPTGTLKPGIPLCPPEGDAGTGMIATNSVRARTGSVSAGTSVFAMIVLEKKLSQVYPEIDMVTTPAGSPVAMVHCNNCSSELDAWAAVFKELVENLGFETNTGAILDAMYASGIEGEPDCGGLFACNYHSGEHITGFAEGRPLFARLPGSTFTLKSFMRAQLYSCVATLRLGLDILLKRENVRIDKLLGHGGFFKAALAGQKIMSAAAGVTVSVMETAGEGGPWGMALLAAYMKRGREDEALADYLQDRIFADAPTVDVEPDEADIEGFAAFMERYKAGLEIERAALEFLKEE